MAEPGDVGAAVEGLGAAMSLAPLGSVPEVRGVPQEAWRRPLRTERDSTRRGNQPSSCVADMSRDATCSGRYTRSVPDCFQEQCPLPNPPETAVARLLRGRD